MMKNALQMLLKSLDTVRLEHAEIKDTAVREVLSDILYRSFIKPEPDYQLSRDFAMFSDEGNALIRTAFLEFLNHPEINTDAVRRLTPEEREAAFYKGDDGFSDSPDLGIYFSYP
jgi:hypothetical protein